MKLMGKRVLSALILTVAVTLFIPTRLHYEVAQAYSQPETVPQLISKYAGIYGSNPHELAAVMKCESGGNQNAIGDGGAAHGIFQFHRSTFSDFEKQMNEKLDIESYNDQIKMAAWAFSTGYQNRWSCYTKIYRV